MTISRASSGLGDIVVGKRVPRPKCQGCGLAMVVCLCTEANVRGQRSKRDRASPTSRTGKAPATETVKNSAPTEVQAQEQRTEVDSHEGATLSTLLAEGVRRSVCGETQRKYGRKIFCVYNFVGGRPDVEVAIVQFLAERSQSHGDVSEFIAALKWDAKMKGSADRLEFLRSERFTSAIAGFEYDEGNPNAPSHQRRKLKKKTKGAIRWDRMVSIVRLAEKKGAKHLARAVLLYYAAWLRPGELERLEVRHVRMNTCDGDVVFISQDKRRNCRSRKGRKRVLGFWKPIPKGRIDVGACWREASRGLQRTDKPFSGVGKQLNKLIAEAAQTYGWKKRLVWERYGLRHGAVMDARSDRMPWSEVTAYGGWSSAEAPRNIYGALGRELLA